MVIGVCGYFGCLQRNKLKQRCRDLQSMLFAVKNIESRLSYGRETMNLILQRIADNINGVTADFLRSVADDLSTAEGLVLDEVWQNNLLRFKDQWAFNDEDWCLLKEFGCDLGVSHTDDQLKKLQCMTVQLEQQLQLSKEDELRLGKVFQAAGWCMGIVLALLFA